MMRIINSLKKMSYYLQKVNKDPFVLQSFITLFLRVFGVVVLFGFTLFLTNNYDPKIIGQYDFVRSFLFVLGSISLLGCDQSILYFKGRLNGSNSLNGFKDTYKKMILLLFSMAVILFLIILGINKDWINSYFSDPKLYFILLKSTGVLFFYSLTVLNTEVFRALEHLYVAELFRNTIKYIPVMLGAVLLAFYGKEAYLAEVFLLGFIVLAITTTAIILYYFSKMDGDFKHVSFSLKEITLKSYPIAISGMAMFLLMSFDIIFLKKYRDDATVAYYSVAIKIMTMLTMVILTVNITISTKISEYFAANNSIELNRVIRKSAWLIFVLTLPLGLFIGLFPEYLLHFFGDDYVVAKDTLLILIVGQGLCSIFGSAPVYLNMTGRQSVFQQILIVAVVINFVLNRLLIPKYGMNGAAIAFVCSSFFWNFISAIVIYKKDKVKVFLN
jgi:O-antigen/teichoic acid export membrane protein